MARTLDVARGGTGGADTCARTQHGRQLDKSHQPNGTTDKWGLQVVSYGRNLIGDDGYLNCAHPVLRPNAKPSSHLESQLHSIAAMKSMGVRYYFKLNYRNVRHRKQNNYGF